MGRARKPQGASPARRTTPQFQTRSLPRLIRVAMALSRISAPDAGQANDNGLLFRASDGQWVYNLSTAGLSSGTYTITVLMPDGRRYDGGFVLR